MLFIFANAPIDLLLKKAIQNIRKNGLNEFPVSIPYSKHDYYKYLGKSDFYSVHYLIPIGLGIINPSYGILGLFGINSIYLGSSNISIYDLAYIISTGAIKISYPGWEDFQEYMQYICLEGFKDELFINIPILLERRHQEIVQNIQNDSQLSEQNKSQLIQEENQKYQKFNEQEKLCYIMQKTLYKEDPKVFTALCTIFKSNFDELPYIDKYNTSTEIISTLITYKKAATNVIPLELNHGHSLQKIVPAGIFRTLSSFYLPFLKSSIYRRDHLAQSMQEFQILDLVYAVTNDQKARDIIEKLDTLVSNSLISRSIVTTFGSPYAKILHDFIGTIMSKALRKLVDDAIRTAYEESIANYPINSIEATDEQLGQISVLAREITKKRKYYFPSLVSSKEQLALLIYCIQKLKPDFAVTFVNLGTIAVLKGILEETRKESFYERYDKSDIEDFRIFGWSLFFTRWLYENISVIIGLFTPKDPTYSIFAVDISNYHRNSNWNSFLNTLKMLQIITPRMDSSKIIIACDGNHGDSALVSRFPIKIRSTRSFKNYVNCVKKAFLRTWSKHGKPLFNDTSNLQSKIRNIAVSMYNRGLDSHLIEKVFDHLYKTGINVSDEIAKYI